MSGVDNRVVEMNFDNAQFEKGVKQTLTSLQQLDKSLKLDGATKGLTDVSNAAKGLSLAHIGAGVDSIAQKFSALSVVAITTLATITTKAISAGAQLAKSLTIDPIKAGLQEYETNLNSIQTILANTQASGATLDDVNRALDELNRYSDQTIYNFAEMAKNIGTFTAAGVDLETATGSIKGIANLAALSGSNSEQASRAMYQLSQAISAGKISLMDWNSVVYAGMGGTVFQRALAETAVAMGKLDGNALKLEGSMKNVTINGEAFRQSISAENGESWLTSDVLTATLEQFTGDLTDAELAAQGFTAAQIEAIKAQAQTAQDAATKVKTLSQLMGVLAETSGSGWKDTWQLIFGDFEEARTLFTNVNNVLSGFINHSAEARNKVIGDWKELGGRTAIIDAISNAFTALISVITPIKDAFRQIFPAVTGKQLYEISVAIRDFTEGLKIGATTAENLKRTFAGVFAIFGIGWEVVKQVARMLADLFGVATSGSGSILEITARVGDFLVRLHEAIKSGDDLTKFFDGLGNILALPIRLIQELGSSLKALFEAKNFDSAGVQKAFAGIFGRLEPLGKLGEAVASAWGKFVDWIDVIWNRFGPLADMLSEVFSGLGTMITDALANVDYSMALDAINTGLFAAIALMVRRFLDGGISVDVGGGMLESIKDTFEGLTDTLSAMQANLKAGTLLKIAGAVALLTVSVVALSLIDSEKLAKALTAITVMFTQLGAAMMLFEKFAMGGIVRMPAFAAALILLSTAILILTAAVKNLSDLDWNELAKGLVGVTVLLGALVATAKLMPPAKGLISTGLGLIVLAAAVKLLASSVKDLSGLSWEEMAKGLVGVGALLGALAIFTRLAAVSRGGLVQGAGLILLAVAIKILASALEDFAAFSWDEIGRGLASMAGGLAILAAALKLIPPTSIFSAAAVLVVAASLGMIADALGQFGGMKWDEIGRGLTAMAGALALIAVALALLPASSLLSAAAIFIVAASLGMIADALGQMGSMDWGEIGKGLVALAGSLAIIALAMYAMSGALPGAAAIFVVAAALKVLAPVLQVFGAMSWEEMGKGLLMLAGVFLVLGVAGLVLTPLVPTLIGLGLAVTLLGIGMLAAGAGILAFSIGLTALGVAGAAATAAIVGIVAGLIGLIPLVMEQIGLGLIAFAEVIANAGPAILGAITAVLNAFIDAIIQLTPKIVNTLLQMLTMMLNALANYVPRMVDAGLRLLVGILDGIARNIGRIVTSATSIIVNFIDGIAQNIPRVIQAGINLIISFVNGLADGIRNNTDRMNAAGRNLASAIIEGMGKGLTSGISSIANKAREVAQGALNAAKRALGIASPSKEFEALGRYSDEGLAKGLDKYSDMVSRSSAGVGKEAILSLSKSISGMSDLVSDNMDVQPTIRPVIDLTGVKSGVDQIDGWLGTQRRVELSGTVNKATGVSTAVLESQTLRDEAREMPEAGDNLTFNQYNNSPKALSAAEIYRQTKNQLSVVRKEL